MPKSFDLIRLATDISKYIPFIEGGGYNLSKSEKEKELKKLRDDVTFNTIKALKISDSIIKEINGHINTLKNNKNFYWFSSLFNKVFEMK